jgi:hypothetical protein
MSSIKSKKKIEVIMYFISFVEEFWDGQREGTWIGRMEYSRDQDDWRDDKYPDEVAIGTANRDAIEALRDEWDFKDVTKEQLDMLKEKIIEINKEKT